MLAALALQDLSGQPDPLAGLHYWFDYGNRKEQTKESVWKDLLRQVIAQGDGPAIQALTSLRKKLGPHRPISSKDLSDALKIVCEVQQFVLVLDGPDEMEKPGNLKAILLPFIKANCRVLVTSRDIPEIRSALSQASKVEVLADASDLRAYVGSRFQENDLDELIERHADLERDILDKSQGIFLLARLLVDHLVDLSTVKEMRKALQVYPTHLDQAFESSLERINAQSKSHTTLAHRVMGWIVSAERQLQISELTHGLAAEEGVDTIDEENLVSAKTILRVCGGLVVVQGTAVKMVHSTVHTWLRNRYDGLYHKDLAESCLRYLTMRLFSSGPAHTVDEMDSRISTFPFFPYAARHWRRHLDRAECVGAFESMDRLLDDPGLRSAALQASNYMNSFKCPVVRTAAFETIPGGHSALHFASYWNLPAKVAKLLSGGGDNNSTDTQLWTPLHWACFGQSREAVEILVSHNANVNAKDSVGWTPLFWAALKGDTRTVQLLLQNGTNYAGRDIHDWTALRWAVASLRMDVVKILLDHHAAALSDPKQRSPALKSLSVDEASRYLNPPKNETIPHRRTRRYLGRGQGVRRRVR
ncbi:hypothetical protein LX36DRAFT_417115 [Colletotrichum falcatum]|nr:hypothetical protein LX36DRAFT_417115 [Colletotrichum falcatum]